MESNRCINCNSILADVHWDSYYVDRKQDTESYCYDHGGYCGNCGYTCYKYTERRYTNREYQTWAVKNNVLARDHWGGAEKIITKNSLYDRTQQPEHETNIEIAAVLGFTAFLGLLAMILTAVFSG